MLQRHLSRQYITSQKSIQVLKLNTGKSGNWTKSEYRSVIYAKRGSGGGTFADPRLALDYAEYLNPKLAIEVKEVFLRYKAADPTLADEVLNRATDEQNEWVATRAMGRVKRNEFTAILDAHEVKGFGYRQGEGQRWIPLQKQPGPYIFA